MLTIVPEYKPSITLFPQYKDHPLPFKSKLCEAYLGSDWGRKELRDSGWLDRVIAGYARDMQV